MEIPYTVKPRQDTGLYNAKVGIWLFLASEVMLFGAFFSTYIVLRVGNEIWPSGLLNVPIGFFNTLVLIFSSLTVIMAWASLKMGQLSKFKIYQGLTVLCAFIFLGVKTVEYREKFVHYQVWLQDGRTLTGHIEGNPFFWTQRTLLEKNIDKIVLHPDEANKSLRTVAALNEEHLEQTHAKDGKAHHEAIEIPTTDIKRLSSFVPAHGPYFAIYFTMTALHGLHVLGGALLMSYYWGPGSRMWRTDPERFTNRIETSGLFWHFGDLVWIFLFPVLYLL